MSDISPPQNAMEASRRSAGPTDAQPVPFQDRATPMWATAISILFSLGSGLCLLSVAIFVVFFYEQVALNGQTLLAALLAVGAVVPLLGMIIFEVGHSRALAGYRYMRLRHAVTGRAVVGLFACAIFAVFSPYLAVPFVLTAALSWLFCGVVAQKMRSESMWEFLPQEAVAFLSGRDQRAVDLANAARGDSAFLDATQSALALCGLIGGFAMASWLVAQDVLNVAAIATIALVTCWSADAFAAFFRQISRADPELQHRAAEVRQLPAPYSADAEGDDTALIVSHLSVRTPDGTPLLSDVSFRAEPGTIIGLSGDSFSGKSLLLRALHAPHDLEGLLVEGHVALQGTGLWARQTEARALSSALVGPIPLSVPGGGANNLSCFIGDLQLQRARKALQNLVFTADTVDRIQNASDVTQLSCTEQKALALARALALRPGLYLLDRPEDGASESLLVALGQRLKSDARLGHITLMITENRQLLEQCDQLLMMQNGRIIEFAATSDIRERQASGWHRFVTPRSLESEEALDGWICSHFRREGDEANRRAVCMVANEMLSLACQSGIETHTEADSLSFEFKHFVGKCQIRMIDSRLALSSGAIQKAKTAADTSVDGERLSPLAKIMRDSLDVESSASDGGGILLVAIKTYDPRLLSSRKVSQDAPRQR
ncbi:ATP-binding cassette domain-containing protein [Shimia sp. R9_2]|uniref:ATP-binding cassette domain-containing protein n=1 Tax=Shimia sp. R9_2 TaxID=2821112 RepID=UPI001ADAB7D8|nr:ATP-binding cassette domain-containing protein [Shimia sp. R9_2]MBO9396354.1 ATP-binding cassette domain-containing protein [Shimia sp. R9_2]